MKLIENVVNKLSLFSTLVIAVVSIVVVIWIIVVSFQFLRDRKTNKSLWQLSSIPKDINVGMLYFALEDPYRIISANDSFYQLLGYNEIEAKNSMKVSLMDFTHPKDNSILQNPVKLRDSKRLNYEIRMVAKGGETVYLLFNGTVVQGEDGKSIVIAIVVDITSQQQLKERMSIERERYRVATELSNDVIFEYDFKSGDIVFTDKYAELFYQNTTIKNFGKKYNDFSGFIYPDDWGIYLEYCRKLIEGSNTIESEIRIKDKYGEYIWCQLISKTIYDENNQPVRVIGKMVNVDVQKKELENLTYKATRDPLTGIYNKEATVKKIENYLNGNKNGKHILMFIDFDDFKKVNDNYGHLVGDNILTFVVKRIQSVFNDGEIIGRIGGDEFVVFIGNIINIQDTIEKANILIDALDTEYINKEQAIPISGSIGIASYPVDGIHFDSLLEKADEALYHVKGQGKNNFMIYNSQYHRG